MNIELIKQRKKELIELHGPWTAENIHLGGGVYTIDQQVPCSSARLIRFAQVISDITDQPFHALRILDLGCLEGGYATEFARQGARVVGIEGRMANVEKIRFTKEVLGLENLEVVQDDVRHLSLEKYGSFDVVLCSGILYHLDAPDVASFLERVAEVCRRCTLIDTHISRTGKKSFVYRGQKYWGSTYIEHRATCTPEERAKALWASLDNPKSFWPTRPSLYNLLHHAGFTSVYECHNPPEIGKPHDRLTLVAIKGRSLTLVASPPSLPVDIWPEKQPINIRYYARTHARRLGFFLPRSVKRLVKRLLGSPT